MEKLPRFPSPRDAGEGVAQRAKRCACQLFRIDGQGRKKKGDREKGADLYLKKGTDLFSGG